MQVRIRIMVQLLVLRVLQEHILIEELVDVLNVQRVIIRVEEAHNV